MPETIIVTETVNRVIVASPFVSVGGGGGGGGVTDHGALTGLADDDHTQYLIGNVGTSTTRNSITMGVGGRGLNIDAVDSVDTHIRLTLNGVQFATWNNESGIVIEPGAGGIQADSLQVLASNTGRATVNIPHGTAPTTPVNGDIWTTTSGVFARVNGSTVGPLGTSGSGALDIPALTNETDIVFADSTVVYDASAVGNREVAVRDILSNPRRRVLYEHDFTTGTQSPWGIFTSSSGSGGGFGTASGDQTEFGVVNVQTNANSAGFGTILTNDTAFRFGGAAYRYDARVIACNVLSDATDTFTVRFGFGNRGNGESTNGALFRYTHSVNGGRWQAVTRDNSVETAVDTGVAVVANTWVWLAVEVNANASEAKFYINGSLVATITTNIPFAVGRTTGVIAAHIIKSAGTNNRAASIDYCAVQIEWTTLR